MKEFDAIVIGAGQAGVPLAKKLANAGWKTVLIEKRLVGGTCINDGCTPTKAMVASARMAYLAGRTDLGIEVSSFKVNFKAVMARKSAIVAQFRNGSIKGIENTKNLTLIYGEAKFLDDHTVSVNESEGDPVKYSAKHIFINTGASPRIPEIEGIKEIKYLTSTSILELQELPEHLLIVGGGYIGLEFGQLFKRLGAKVTIMEQSSRLMPKEDDDVCEVMSGIFKEDGIEVLTESKVLKFETLANEKIKVTVDSKGEKHIHTCSHVLIASGRVPQTAALGLENTAVECDVRGHIKVNEYLETKVKHIYALGDVKGGPAFTHISYNDYIVVTKNILEGLKMSTKDRMIPYCMFTDPQLGRIGITEVEAKELGLDYLVAKIPMKNVARAIETAETRGFMKAVVDPKTKQILGAAIIGEQGGEIMSVLQMAMMGKITYEEIRFAIFAHPLYAESLNNLFMSIV
ncbi:mercuric reductase [Pedobacter cryoconitis]|uniref:Dihydrolipoamide dehydrogenase n=1 Tax=Pedobacter cryoconitis TaxID=188932 RepID=A0A7X0J7K0_9SPHI|nr:mercuric reductase [Pedobacter cryoconitis]MBB6502433.1 dihydrolipoamide dehydrogenase [Pedobacter cryoconitis]